MLQASVYKYKRKVFATTQKVNKRTWTAKEVFSPSARVTQMSFDMNDGYVNTLTVADFNLFSRAIEGDTPGLNL